MERREAIHALAEIKGESLSVATMQTMGPWHEVGKGENSHLDAIGCMGAAMSLGLGLALACHPRKVMVLDGDGSLLMQLGSLVSIAGTRATNFYHFVFNDGVYCTSGNQSLPANHLLDFTRLALAAGYRNAYSFRNKTDLQNRLPQIMTQEGPILINLELEASGKKEAWPKVKMFEQVIKLKEELAMH